MIDIPMNYIRKSKAAALVVDVVYARARQTRNGVDDKRSPDKKERQLAHTCIRKQTLLDGWLDSLCFRRRMTAEVEPNTLATLHP